MSEYSGIRGTRVKYLASDPTLNTSTEGQVWYNSTEGTLKSLVQIKATSASGNLSTARRTLGGAGTQTAALAFGGFVTASSNATEEYSGFTWSNGGNLNQARQIGNASTGTQTAGLGVGGYNPPGATNNVEEYDGSSWTSVTAFPVNIYAQAGAGIQTASIFFGGSVTPPFAKTAVTQEYDGTNWTAGGSLSLARDNLAGSGTLTAGLAIGGRDPGSANVTDTEEYNGTSWTTGGSLPAAKKELAASGTQTLTTAFGGEGVSTAYLDTIEEYDGSSWTASSATLATARLGMGSGGSTGSASVVFGGNTGSNTAATEEYNSNINAITQAAWASGGNLIDARYGIAGFGIQTAALGFGGFSPGTVGLTESYDGTSWTEVNDLGTASFEKGAAGTQTAGLAFGGSPGACESWDGTNWTSSPALNTDRRAFGSAGLQTAALAFGGRPEPTVSAATEEWNGSSWTSSNDLNTARRNSSGAGSQTAALGFGGYVEPAGGLTGATEEYDGTSWTTSPGSLNTARMSMPTNVYGTQSLALAYGGVPPASAATESWNGTSWAVSANMATARGAGGGAGTNNTSALIFGGRSPVGPTTFSATEEFTAGTETVTASTLTTS